MDDMVLVSTRNTAGLSGAGRPTRKNFCLRKYGHIHTLGIPHHVCDEGSRADLMVSSDGFAIKFNEDGERMVNGTRTVRNTMIPKAIWKHIHNFQEGVTELVSEELPDRTWFFPFSQFLASE